jgi:hypothetical protein
MLVIFIVKDGQERGEDEEIPGLEARGEIVSLSPKLDETSNGIVSRLTVASSNVQG